MNGAARERQAPIGLIIAGLVVYLFVAFRLAGPRGAPVAMGIVAVAAVLGTGLMLLAAFLTAAITRQSFGELSTGILKLAGIYIFSTAIAGLIPGAIGILIEDALFFSLLIWLFELEVPYAVVFMLVMMGINLIIGLLVVALVLHNP